MTRVSILLLVASILTGCATTEVLRSTPIPNDKLARVIFIRKDFPPAGIATLRVIETDAARIADNDLVALNVPLGDIYIHLNLVNGSFFSFTLPVKDERTLYVLLTGSTDSLSQSERNQAYAQGGVRWTHQIQHQARIVSQEEARRLVTAFGKSLE